MENFAAVHCLTELRIVSYLFCLKEAGRLIVNFQKSFIIQHTALVLSNFHFAIKVYLTDTVLPGL